MGTTGPLTCAAAAAHPYKRRLTLGAVCTQLRPFDIGSLSRPKSQMCS